MKRVVERDEPVLPFVRTPYNYDRNAAGDESGLCCQDESLTRQSFNEEADINTIVRRFRLTGELPSDVRAPTYGDFTGVSDYHSALSAIALAREAFDQMPAEVRSRFRNSPEEFVEFCSDERNRGEAEKLGLVFRRESGNVDVPGTGAGERDDNGSRSGVQQGRRPDVRTGAGGDDRRVRTEERPGSAPGGSGDRAGRDSGSARPAGEGSSGS